MKLKDCLKLVSLLPLITQVVVAQQRAVFAHFMVCITYSHLNLTQVISVLKAHSTNPQVSSMDLPIHIPPIFGAMISQRPKL